MEGMMVELQVAKSETTIQQSILSQVWKHLDMLDEGISIFDSVITLDISSCVTGNQNRYSKPSHGVFLTITKCFLCLNPTRA